MDLLTRFSDNRRLRLVRIRDAKAFMAWFDDATYKMLQIVCPRAAEICKGDSFVVISPAGAGSCLGRVADVWMDSIQLEMRRPRKHQRRKLST